MEIARRALNLALASEVRYASRGNERQRAKDAAQRGDLWNVDTPDRIRKRLDHLSDAAGPVAREAAPGLRAQESAAEDAVIRLSRERAIGEVDLVAPRYLQLALRAGNCVGRITVKTSAGKLLGYGTGWLVAPRVLLTNHHVLETANDAESSEVVFSFDSPDPLTGVRTAALDPSALFVTDVGLDFTFVGVAAADTRQRPLSDLGCLSLNAAEGKVINREFVTLVQYPSGGPKMFALRENRVVDVLYDYLHYEADTAPGSSGSPVMNDQFEVVALHHSGVPARNASGRVLNVDGKPWAPEQSENQVQWVANEGVRVSRLVAKAKEIVQGTAQESLLASAWNVNTSVPRVDAVPLSFPLATTAAAQIAEAARPATVTVDGNTATWSIPLQVSIQLGGPAPQAATPKPPLVASTPIDIARAAVAVPPVSTAPSVDAPELVKAVGLAKHVFKSVPGIIEIRSGWRFSGGWITDRRAVVVVVGHKLTEGELRDAGIAALPGELAGYPVEVRQASAEELMEYSKLQSGDIEVTEREANPSYQPPGLPLPRIREQMKVTVHVSPEAGWPTLKAFLGATNNHLTVGMYDFGATHIRDALTDTLSTPKTMRLLIQYGQTLEGTTKKDDLTDAVIMADLQAAMEQRFDGRWVSVSQSGSLFASAYHIKVAVQDHQAMWLSSGNWQSSNQPPELPAANDEAGNKTLLESYNREWHVVVENVTLSKSYEDYIDYDYEQSNGFTPKGLNTELYELTDEQAAFEEAATKRKIVVFSPLTIDRMVDVQAVLSPDNYVDIVMEHLKSATTSLYFQNQYINESKDPRARADYVKLVKQLASKQKAGLDVRIILRRETGVEPRHLEFMKSNGIDVDAIRWRNKSHTKGIIVDGERVLVGSHNWSYDGVKLNRDASLLFYDKELAQYFQKVFLYDWENWTYARPIVKTKKPKVEELSPAEVQALPQSVFARPLQREG